MKKTFTTLWLSTVLCTLAFSQDTVRSLIISEWRGDGTFTDGYIELTNVGDSALDLSRFMLFTYTAGPAITPAANQQAHLSGILQPDSSWLAIRKTADIAADGRLQYREILEPIADLVVYHGGPEPTDSVSPFYKVLRFNAGRSYSGIFYYLSDTDSVLIDAVNNSYDGQTYGGIVSTVAGIPEAVGTHILVRKANVTQGNTNWDDARGVDLTDSEWLPVPEDGGWGGIPYTTVRNHGDYSIDFTAANPDVVIDLNNKALTIPWGIYSGDSIIMHLNLGKNMAWEYINAPSLEDSVYNTCRTGDVLRLYACGNDLEVMDFDLTVSDPSSDASTVYPKSYKNDAGDWPTPFYVTNMEPVIDTIGDVPFALRVDSLYNYLEKAPEATLEIVWVDETERVDLKFGDILEVTAQDGSTKEYFIDVADYAANSNASLGAITWPDMPGFISDQWHGDTIPSFNPSAYSYTLELPYGTTMVPALTALAQNQNATFEVQRATSLKGSIEDRTTTFTVTAEDDSTVLSYSVLFNVMVLPSLVQKYSPEPFFSEFVARQNQQNCYTEIVNSGNQPMLLNNYMIVTSKTINNPAEAIAQENGSTDDNYQARYLHYVPGYKFTADTTKWRANPGLLEADPNIDPLVEPGDVFVLHRSHNSKIYEAQYSEADIVFSPSQQEMEDAGVYDFPVLNPWGEILPDFNTVGDVFNSNHFLFMIDNDSILEGTKGVFDPYDFTLVDVFGNDPITGNWTLNGTEFTGNQHKKLNVILNPDVTGGVHNLGDGTGDSTVRGNWFVRSDFFEIDGVRTPQAALGDQIGFHTMDPVTIYMSTVSSLTYLVGDGYVQADILGVVDGTDVDGFLANIIKADSDQTLVINGTADGAEKTGTDVLLDGDTLIVTSKNMENVTKYILDVSADGLDDNAVIVNAAGSDYTIDITGATGTISGIAYFSTLEGVVDKLVIPGTATWNIIDDKGSLVPFQMLNSDTLLVPTLVGGENYIEVIAQNGVNIITYQLIPTALSSDAFVFSSVYDVDQDELTISKIRDNTSVSTFRSNVEAVAGASIKLLDKIGHERVIGTVSYDDILVVSSEDGTNTTSYYLNFFNEVLDPNTKIEVEFSADQLSINVYPNPAKDFINIEFDQDSQGVKTIWVADLTGKMLHVSEHYDNNIRINMDHIEPGLYIVFIRCNNDLITKKVVFSK